MSDRLTTHDLERVIAILARELNLPDKPWVQDASGRHISVDGALALDSAYGGYSLVQIVGTGGGEREITTTRQSKRELYRTVSAMIEVVRRAKMWRSGK